MKRIAAALVALASIGCASRENAGGDRLVVYSAGPRPLAEAICASFTETTGMPVDLFQATTGQLMARLEAEKYRPRADVVLFASEIAAAALKQDHRLLRFRPAAADRLRDGWSDSDEMYWASGAALVGVAVRREFADRAPTRWADWFALADARRVVMPSPSRSGATGDFVVGLELEMPKSTFPAFARMRLAGMDFAAANSQAIAGLQMAVYDALIGAVDYLIFQQIARGEQIEMRYPEEGAILVTRPIAILSATPRPDAARTFVDFYLNLESQRKVAAAHLAPARVDVEPSPLRGPAWPRVLRADPAEAVKRQASILRRFQLEIERAASSRALKRAAGEGV